MKHQEVYTAVAGFTNSAIESTALSAFTNSDITLNTKSVTSDFNKKSATNFKNEVPLSTWHKRLGHLNFASISHISNTNMIQVSAGKKLHVVCSVYQMSKSCRLPFHLSKELSIAPFDKIHCDLWGPTPITSCQGFKYYTSFIDDHSRFTWIFPLKRKLELYECFLKFHKTINTQFDKKIEIFQSDGGGEFTSTKLKNFLDQQGIVHQMSCPHTPQQNGVAKR